MKKDLRQSIKLVLENKTNKIEASQLILGRLANLDVYKKAEIVFCYKSVDNEVNTEIIISDLLSSKKTVCVPRTTQEMHFIKIDKDTVYSKGAFGIKEPSFGEEITNCDLMIVPMVAFDKNCNRMGHGKGYYDRYLFNKNCFKIGIAFEEQEGKFEVYPHDIAMDMVITEKNIFLKTNNLS